MEDLAHLVSTHLPRELAAEVIALARSRGADFAEVYGEYTVNTGFSLEESRVKASQYSINQGVGIRAIKGEVTAYAHADGFAADDLREAARIAARVANDGPANGAGLSFRAVTAKPPFEVDRPAPIALDEAARVAMLRRADDAARSFDGRIREVAVSFADSSRSFVIANSDGLWADDKQHISRFVVDALAIEGDRRQSGFEAAGGAVGISYYEEKKTPEDVAGEAARMAVTLLGAKEPDAGAYPVVVGPGWGGVLVHECFGHSMEGDTIRKKTSIRATQLGTGVAAKGVTIVDSGVVPFSRGSFRVDDEGTPAQRTVLVQDGVLVGYMWDLLNARLTGHRPTGNGRRSSYRHFPLCRMTNTYIEAGSQSPDQLIESIPKGLYCRKLGGGSVNPADGNFSFQVTEAYRIENGKLTYPVRNATLTGNGNDAMLKIDGVASDLDIDGTTGSCGKSGQWKAVGVGQPTVRFTEITVGGNSNVKPDTEKKLASVAEMALDAARRAGATSAEACVEDGHSFSVRVQGGAIETLKQSVSHGLGLRVIVDDRVGFASTNDFRPEALGDLARRAVTLARFSTPDPANALPTPAEAAGTHTADDAAGNGARLELRDPQLATLTTERKIEMALTLERTALAHDARILRTQGASVDSRDGTAVVANTLGVYAAETGTSVSYSIVPLAEDSEGRQQTGYYSVVKRHLEELPPLEEAALEAARRAVARIGARTVPSARVPVVMHPDVASAWISELHGAFSGEAVMLKQSWLTGKLGESVASARMTLVDDGRLRRGVGSSPSDGEGVATRRNVLIERGRCAMYLYDTYNARRTGTRSTGSAVRSYASVPGIGYHNLYVEAGDKSADAILRMVDDGFYMDDQGSFGFNAVTGDYSFQAQGFWIKKGEKSFPVDGVTVASNSLNMLARIEAIGNDLGFEHAVSCPTLLIGEMTVSGAA